MVRFVIEVKKDLDMITDSIRELIINGDIGKMQGKVFAAIYKSKLKSLYIIMKRKLNIYIDSETDNGFFAVDEGTLEYCNSQKRKFEKFIYGDEKELKQNKEYSKFKNDRIIINIMNKISRGARKSKNKAIDHALGGGRVFDFFNRYGIIIVWRIEV